MAGRTIGFVATFAMPVVLVRTFDQAAFGTYKQLFLIYGTLYGLAQLGVAESLYYFVPREPEAGRHIANALVTLALAGLACLRVPVVGRAAIADVADQPAAGRAAAAAGRVSRADARRRASRS